MASASGKKRFISGWLSDEQSPSAIMAFIWEVQHTDQADQPLEYEAEVVQDVYKCDTLRAATVEELRAMLDQKYGSTPRLKADV